CPLSDRAASVSARIPTHRADARSPLPVPVRDWRLRPATEFHWQSIARDKRPVENATEKLKVGGGERTPSLTGTGRREPPKGGGWGCGIRCHLSQSQLRFRVPRPSPIKDVDDRPRANSLNVVSPRPFAVR